MSKPRFSVEPEYEWQEGCRCGSCYEPTGRWKICDIDDIKENEYFDSEEEANKRCKELNERQEMQDHAIQTHFVRNR